VRVFHFVAIAKDGIVTTDAARKFEMKYIVAVGESLRMVRELVQALS